MSKEVAASLNEAIGLANTLETTDREWALASIIQALAYARDFSSALEMAKQIVTPRRKAYAYAGIARAAIEQDNAPRVRTSLEALEAAANSETEVVDVVDVTAQSVLALLEPLLDDEPVGFAEAVAGLH